MDTFSSEHAPYNQNIKTVTFTQVCQPNPLRPIFIMALFHDF